MQRRLIMIVACVLGLMVVVVFVGVRRLHAIAQDAPEGRVTKAIAVK